MSDIRLTCDETPLAWPSTVGVDDLTKCGSCGFRMLTSQPGSLQVLTRRQGSAAAGDGVNIEEDPALGVDYRGQRYTYEESYSMYRVYMCSLDKRRHIQLNIICISRHSRRRSERLR